MPTDPIVETCRRPAATRRRAMAAEPVPCPRCTAYRPETQSGCHFVEVGAVPILISPRRRPAPGEQTKIW